MPNAAEATCLQEGREGGHGEGGDGRGGLVETPMACVDRKTFWSADLGWRAIPKRLRASVVRRVLGEDST